jgi:C4-type Zn-finger protein
MENDEERRERLRQRIKKISEKAKDYLPEISGAAVGAAFGNPVVGAVAGVMAKKLLDSFIKAKKKPLDFDEAIKNNIERFTDATIAASGKTKETVTMRVTSDTHSISFTPTELQFYTSTTYNER